MQNFSYAEVHAILCEAFQIASTKRIAFGSRLKALMKHGVPARERQGRGYVAEFTLDHLMQLAVATELTRCGIAPLSAAKVVNEGWWLQLDRVYSVLRGIASSTDASGFASGWVFAAHINTFEELMENVVGQRTTSLGVLGAANLQSYMTSDNFTTVSDARAVIINPVILFEAVISACLSETGRPELDEWPRFYESLEEYIELTADLFERNLEIDYLRAKRSQEENDQAVEALRQSAMILFKGSEGKPYGMRALGYAIGPPAFYELKWIITSAVDRDKLIVDAPDDVLKVREQGQRDLAEVGLIEDTDGFLESGPRLTKLGIEFVRHFV